MMQQTPWWKGIKFWITFLLAAYAAAAATWLLLRDREASQTPQARNEPALPAPAVDEPSTDPVFWRERIRAARLRLLAVMQAQGTSDAQGLVRWVTLSLLPDLGTIWESDPVFGAASKLEREQAACLAELEWSLAALTRRVRERDPKGPVKDVADLDERLAGEGDDISSIAYWVARLRARGPDAKALVERVWRLWLAGKGENDATVRALLGYVEFQHEIHPDLAFRRHAFIREVERANEKRWFTTAETTELASARLAATRVDAHVKRLMADAKFRAVENLKANLYERAELRDLHMITHWAEPYLVCYLSELDLGRDTRVGFRPASADVRTASREHRRFAHALMAARGALYQAVHTEFHRRWAKRLRIAPLMDPYGGRPDYPVQIRSYAEGCPLQVLLFDQRMGTSRIFDLMHANFGSNVAAPFGSAQLQHRPDGRVVAVERGPGGRIPGQGEAECVEHARAAAVQLWFWSIRQRNNWRYPPRGMDLGSAALVAQLRALKGQGDKITFGRWSGSELQEFQTFVKQLSDQGAPRRWIPLEFLASVTDLSQLANWLATNWGIGADGVFQYRVYAAAFANLCLGSGDARLEKAFVQYLDLIAHGEGGRGAKHAFEEAFRIRDDDDWMQLHEKLEVVLNAMLKEDPTQWRYTPAPLPK